MQNAATEALESISVIVNTERGTDGQPWTWKSQVDAIRSVLTLVDSSASVKPGRIEAGDWVEVAFSDSSLPAGNRYKVKKDFGKALELEGLDRLHSAMIFSKIEGPNAPR